MRTIILCLFIFTVLINAKGKDTVYCKDSSLVDKFFSLVGISSQDKGYNKSYALVIGISQYQDKTFADLPTEDDPIDIANYLCTQGGFDHVRLLTEDKVTLSRVRGLMEDYYPKLLNANDRFLFYWSGHGEDEELGSLSLGHLPVQKSQSETYSTMIKMKEITLWDERLKRKSKQTLYLIDSCFSGLVGFIGQDSKSKKLTLEQLAHSSHQILSAGTGTQKTLAILA